MDNEEQALEEHERTLVARAQELYDEAERSGSYERVGQALLTLNVQILASRVSALERRVQRLEQQ
jgi:hypothetical protein